MPLLAAGDGAPNPWFQWSFVTSHRDLIVTATRQHVTLTVTAVLIGLLISVPLALLARRARWTSTPILGFTGALYTIPALAFIVAMQAFFGLGRLTVLIPLVCYTLLILVRNMVAGLDGVPIDVREAARGMGFGPTRLLLRVELPLALPAIVAGLRIATVSTIELAVIGAYIGEVNYGRFIFDGLQNNFYRAEVTTGVALTVLLAVIADVSLLGVQKLVSPWERRRTS